MRKNRRVEGVDFAAAAPEAIVAFMARLATAGDGWINLVPKAAGEEVETRLGFSTLFGGGGAGITMCTWVPARSEGPERLTVELGIEHVTGRRALGQLAEHGIVLPEGWIAKQDHPRRGLVLRVPVEAPNDVVLGWALSAAQALGAGRRNGAWRAEVHLPAGT